MRRIILLLLIVCARLHAQNIEGQIVASQFGQFQVPGTADGSLQFSPASCQVSGGGKIFSAFAAGVPIKIVDSNPALTEVDTPTAAVMNPCFVSMSTSYLHSIPFYLTSGTGGLQEALLNGIRESGGPNSVILNADWYAQVSPANPATVIASVKGSTALGLVDVTTTPYTYYQWSGTNYAVTANGGGSANFPVGPGIVYSNNVSSAVNASSSQIATALNTSPSTLLSPSVLPLGTSSTVGVVKSDGVTTSISGSGVISANNASGTANEIVATPNGTSGIASPRAMVPADMPVATGSTFGAVKPDGTSITVSGGVISSVGGGGGAPGGSPTNVQFYGASTFAGDSTFTFNSSSHTLAFQNGTSGATAPAGDNSSRIANTAAVFNSMPGLTAQYFGAYGDAYQPPDGCSTTASSTTVTCNDSPFVATDVGKQFWESGAGAAGAAFNATITAYTSSTTVTVSATATATVTNGRGIFGHDDKTAVQACFQYSATNAVQCVLKAAPSPGNGLTGFLIGSGGLQLVSNNVYEENSGENVAGNSQVNGTNLFCEYNGDCLSVAGGAIQGTNVSNLTFNEDPTQPAGRAIHLNPSNGAFGPGPFTSANFNNVTVNNPALECLWMDGGGGAGYTYTLPNQYVNFYQFYCNGPVQSHPANLMKMTGQAAQILFLGGQVNGWGYSGGSSSMYPNPLISITEKTTGLGDTPVDVKFIGYTFESGTQGLYVGNGSNNIHFDNGYIENMSSPLIALNSPGLTFNGNHIANSGNIGAVAQLTGGTTASMRDDYVYGGAEPPAAFAVCTGSGNAVDFAQNNSTVVTTTNCATSTESTGGSSITIPEASTASVTATGSFNTIFAPGVSPGKTLTMYTAGGMQLTSGGNIAFGNYTAPLTIPSSGSVTLTLLDAGVTWLVTSAPPPSIGSPAWSSITAGANTQTGSFSTVAPWTFSQNVYLNSNSGITMMQYGPGTTCSGSCTNVYDDGNFHIDGTANGNRGLFFKGQFSTQYIAAFQPASGTNVFEVGLDGSLLSSGHLTLASSRKGTFTCTAGGTITIANTNETTTSDVVISLNTAGGTISTPPAMKTVTAGTGFTVLCAAADTSIYNYDILN